MRCTLSLALLLTLFCCVSISGQTPVASPTPPPADDTDIVKITTTLIQIDVTVTDAKGRILTDLRPDEIEIYENGEKQQITNFSFVSNLRQSEENVSKPRDKKEEVLLPPSTIRAEKVRRTIALVVDDLTLSFESTYYVRRALKKFVDEQMQDGDLVAIIRTGAGIGALQQFTNDKRQLLAAIEKVRWNAVGSGKIGAFAPLEARIASGDDEDDSEGGARTAEGREREFDDFRESLFATGTLGAVNYVVRGMQDLPGRKSVMLLSDGFSLTTTDASGFKESGRVLDSIRRLVDMANRASVVVYTMDARGLQFPGITAADDVSGYSPQQIDQEMSNRRNRLLDTQDGLRYLAYQTGGISVINNNDLSGGIRKILDDQSYYLVAYAPDDATFDPKVRRFHRLEVKVLRKGARVRYRSGFFGVSDDRLTAREKERTLGERLISAITSPFSVQQVSLRLSALYYNAPNEGNIIRSLVHVRPQEIKFQDTPDGSKKATFDILAVGFGDNGTVIDQIAKTYTLTLKKPTYDRFMQEGFVYDFSFPIKKPGAYQLRIAIRDHGSDKIGSANQFVEVPNLKKNRLQLSGVVLENLPPDDWTKREAGQPISDRSAGPLIDTSLRQFKRGTILGFGFSIYNAKLTPQASLHSQVRLFRDGKVLFEGKLNPLSRSPASAPGVVDFSSAIALGTELVPGDYVMQISIIDNLAKAKRNTASQFVQFEVID